MTECSICLDPILPKTKNIILDCNHIFHYDCIVNVTSNSCPLCRKEIISGNICKENHSMRTFFYVPYFKKNGECRICSGKSLKVSLDQRLLNVKKIVE